MDSTVDGLQICWAGVVVVVVGVGSGTRQVAQTCK